MIPIAIRIGLCEISHSAKVVGSQVNAASEAKSTPLKFLPTIDRPTRITSISATLIDNVVINFPLEETNSAIICQNISDHLPILISIELKFSKTNINIENKTYRKINDINQLIF